MTREAMINAYLPLARRLAKRFRRRGEDPDDLTQVAMIGLIHAVDRFNPEFGRPFVAFAVPTIVGELRRHFRDQSWMLHVGRSLQERYIAVSAVIPELCQRLQRMPTTADVAAALDLPAAEVQRAMLCASAYTARSLNIPAQPGGEIPLCEVLGQPDHDLELVPDRHALRQALAGLRPRDLEILRLRFVEHMTQRQIAAKIGVSQVHVSRLLVRIFDALRVQLAE